MAKRLGIIRQGYSQPLFYALRDRTMNHPDPQVPFELIEDSPSKLAQKLRQHELDAAFLSPIEYAQLSESFRIIPGIGVFSAVESRCVQLLFKEHLRKIKTIAVNPQVSASDVVLSNLVLAEQYELTPQIVPMLTSPAESLTKTDAVLITGDDIFTLQDSHRLDLVEEWSDLTELPYVHGIWIAGKNGLSGSEIRMIIDLADQGVAEYEFLTPQQQWYEEHFGYHLHEDAVNGLTEFLQMAYYHGILKEIVLPRFFQVDNISRN